MRRFQRRDFSSCGLERKTISTPWLFRGAAIIGIRGQSKIMQRPSLKEFRRIFFLPTDGGVNSQNILSRAIRKLLSVILNGTLASEVLKEEKSL